MNIEPKVIAALTIDGIAIVMIMYTLSAMFCRWAFADGKTVSSETHLPIWKDAPAPPKRNDHPIEEAIFN